MLDRIDAVGEVLGRDQLALAGLSRSAYYRLLNSGELIRLAGSSLVTARRWRTADRWSRFRMRAIAVAQCGPPDLHLTGWAAAVVHGLPVFGSPPRLPVGLIPGDPQRGSQLSPYFRYRRGWLPEHRQVVRSDVRVVDEAFTAVDIARHHGRQAGLIIADHVLSQRIPREELIAICDNMRAYPGITDARWCAEHASDRSESPVESLGRWAFLDQRRTAPLANVWFWRGRLRYRADLYLPDQKVILEADGAVKYDNRPDASRVVRDQVRREEDLRSWNLGLVRYTYSDPLEDAALLVRRADRAALLRPDLPLLCQWSQEPPWLR